MRQTFRLLIPALFLCTAAAVAPGQSAPVETPTPAPAPERAPAAIRGTTPAASPATSPAASPATTPAASLATTPGASSATKEAVRAAPLDGMSSSFGRTVLSLAYTSDGSIDVEEITRLVSLRVGQPLSEKATAATIRDIFETGRFSDVQIGVVPAAAAADGVDVVIHLARMFRVHPVRFRGATGLSRDELLRVLPFADSAAFHAADVEAGATALKRRFEEEGYLHCEVFSDVTFDREKFRVRVVYRIVPGKPARVAPVFFDGEIQPMSPEDLRKKTRLAPGDRYRESKARADAVRMTEFLHKNWRLRGNVELIAAEPTDDGRIMPVYRITVGPKVVFESTGISPAKLRRELHDFLEGQGFDEDVVLQYVETKKRELQGKGYYRAKVEYTLADTPDTFTVRIQVEPGQHEEIERIAFTGNTSVPDKLLLALMVTRKKGLPFIRPGHLVEDDLTEDVSAILGYYQTHGWVGARVDRPVIAEGSKPKRLDITIPIHEGPRALVASRHIAGAEHADSSALEQAMLIRIGNPYNPLVVRQDATNLAVYFHDRGWRDAVVHDETKVSADGTGAAVLLRVDEGTRSFFGKTVIRGNTRTDTNRVRRLVTWQEGRPFSETDLFDTQRNLSRAGVFRRVDVRPGIPDPETGARNVVINLQEGKPLSLLYGVGYQYTPDALSNQSDPFLVGGISYNNLFGRMLSAGLEGQISISGRYRLQLSFRDPYFLNRDLTFTSFFFATREPIQDVDLDRLGFANEVSHYFGRFLRVALRAEYQRIRPVNPQALSQAIEATDFPRFDQPIEEATIGTSAFYDRRDDIIDPHRGYYASAAVKYAFPILTAQARYSKVSTQFSWFLPIGGSVFATSARIGGIFPYGPSDIQVPLAERFFAGGQSTGRGFEQDLLGISGQTVDYDTRATLHTGSGAGSCSGTSPALAGYDCNAGPHIVGGNGFFSFNAEYRFPIFGALGGTVFYDLAQVWKSFSDLNFRLEGDAGLRQTAGFGLRYMTPIGPVRAEFGLPLRPRQVPYNVVYTDPNGTPVLLGKGDVKEKGRFIITIGYPF